MEVVLDLCAKTATLKAPIAAVGGLECPSCRSRNGAAAGDSTGEVPIYAVAERTRWWRMPAHEWPTSARRRLGEGGCKRDRMLASNGA